MAAWFMRRLRCADKIQPADGIAIPVGRGFRARVAGEQFTLSRAENSHRRRKAANSYLHDDRDNVLHARARGHALN
jgi:hypothetical protein